MLTVYFHGVRKVFHAVKMCFHGLKIDFQGLKNFNYKSKRESFTGLSKCNCLSLLSDSNQRPRDYKSRALANCAKEAGGTACYIAPLQPAALAAVKPWGIHKEHAV